MEWKKITSDTFELTDNESSLGILQIKSSGNTWQQQGKSYGYRVKSKWRNQYQLTDSNNQVVGEIHPKTWYGTSMVITLHEKIYLLTYTNNPLAALQLTNPAGKILIQARLTTVDGYAKSEFGIASDFIKTEYALWLASIVWTHFYPIAQSECNDSDVATFIILMAS